MGGNTAQITWTSDDAQVLRSFQSIERVMQNLARDMDKVKQKSEQAANAATSGFDKMGVAIGRTAMALIGGGSLMTAVDMVRDVTQKLIADAQEANKEYDRLFRSFNVQAGLTALQGDKAKARILDIATANAVREDVAVAGARGLVGSGFSVDDATGGALQALLRGRAATNATGGNADDLEGISTSLAAYIQSQGGTKDARTLNSVLQGGFALRQTGAFELQDLTELGKHGAALRGYMNQEEQFAAYGTLVDQMPAAEAATSLRNIVSRLSTSRTGRTSKDALKMLGLKPDDVDLVGEDFGTVLGRLDGGLANLPEEQRASALKLLFEEAGVAPAKALIRERTGRYEEYRRSQRGIGGSYEETIRTAQSGREAASIRLGVQTNRSNAAADEGDDLVLAALDQEERERGRSGPTRALTQAEYKLLRYFGGPRMTPERTLGLLDRDDWFQDRSTLPGEVLGRVSQAAGGDTGSAALNAAIQRNTAALEANTRERQRTEPRPASPPEAALSD